MRPLFHAVAHGCAAGKHQQALDEVYWPRIRRKDEAYIVKKLGAFSDDLAVVAHFFDKPWDTPAAGLTPADQAIVLNSAGFHLRALGRLREALQPIRASMEMSVEQQDWKGAAQDASNLSELQLTLGDVADAVQTGAQSVAYADQSEDWSWHMVSRTAHADALHQAGQIDEAQTLLAQAEQLQQDRQPEYPRLYSVQGFRYCDLLLAQGKTDEVLERHNEWVQWRQEGDSLLDRSLEHLTLGRAYLQQHNWSRAAKWLQQAVAGLREARHNEFIVRGLLARAELFRHTEDYAKAEKDLQEVYDIAQPSGMRLHLTDYHLESAQMVRFVPQQHPTQCANCRVSVSETNRTNKVL